MTIFRANKKTDVKKPDIIQPVFPVQDPHVGQLPLPPRAEEKPGIGRHNPKRVPVLGMFD